MFNVINKTRFRMDDVGLTIRVFFGNAWNLATRFIEMKDSKRADTWKE
jgi:hypothetical protein